MQRCAPRLVVADGVVEDAPRYRDVSSGVIGSQGDRLQREKRYNFEAGKLYGVVAWPYTIQNSRLYKRLPFLEEYRILISTIPLVAATFYMSVYLKRRCERNIKEKLKEMKIDI
ncbi:hypothetical protein QAD02_000253 [Eretmocerus hayati]|uniref:Uncharacterized protein n=1 Tax=Eretmocerus hayati TaxID=131215 RepID=A0ACC2NCU3_9HYME|nr:hypothetical protein QAD02_000253 [Eretmocerus hayati]